MSKNLVWFEEAEKIVIDNFGSVDPEDIADMVNKSNYQRYLDTGDKRILKTSAGGVIYRAHKLNLIDNDELQNYLRLQRNQLSRKYKAKKRANGGSYTVEEWKDLCKKTGNKCLCCGKKGSYHTLHADHINPVALGGDSNITNIQPLCQSCNSRKGANFTDYRRSNKSLEHDRLRRWYAMAKSKKGRIKGIKRR